MRIGTMLRDIVDGLFRQPATQQYPFVKMKAPERLRGALVWNPEKCTGCSLCAKDCPSNALEVIKIDMAKRQFVVKYYVDRCTFCAQCVQNCRFKCMGMSNEQWELASLKKEPFTIFYGNEENLKKLAEQFNSPQLKDAAEEK